MKRHLKRNLLFLTIAIVIVSGSLFGVRLLFVNAYMQERVLLEEQTSPLVPLAREEQEAADDQWLQLAIGLQLQNQAAAESLQAAISDPLSPSYQQHLTPEQFKQYFAPTAEQVQRVVNYLQGQGFVVNEIAPNNLVINAGATVAQIEQAFQIQIKTYRLDERVFYANETPPSMPREVGDFVTSISGLDDSMSYQPRSIAPGFTAQITEQGALEPEDLAHAYNLTPLHERNIRGQGQTIALFTLDGYLESDIQTYFEHYQIPRPNIERILVDNDDGAAGQGAIETTMDIEMLGSIAPQAKILVYEGPNTIQGVTNTYTKIVNDNAAQVVSISWGLCEASMGEAQLKTLQNIFLQGALQGMTFFAASGDAGAYDCQDNNLGVDSPASDPNVLGVGGTTLQLDDFGNYLSESAWSNPNDNVHGPKGAGSGGGLSTYFARPSWQTGPGVDNAYSNGKRQVPDIAAFADPAKGFAIYCTVRNAGCPETGWTKAGGTSIASPFWAASMALANQYLQVNQRATAGHMNAVLYQLFATTQPYASFRDVTGGTNLYYPATAGYDLATGIGTPDIYNIAQNLVALSPAPVPTKTPVIPTVTPTATATPRPPAALVQNGGLENGTSPWRESSTAGYELVDMSNPRQGTYSIFLCGYTTCDDRIWQTFNIPSSYTSVTLTYWWYADSSGNATQCVDSLTTRLLTSSGSVLQDVNKVCNTQAAGRWIKQTVDLTSILTAQKGTRISLQFLGINGTAQVTSFYVDDISIDVK